MDVLLKNNMFITTQEEITQSEHFFSLLNENNLLNPRAVIRLTDSYKIVLGARNYLHIISHHKNDRLEFEQQEK